MSDEVVRQKHCPDCGRMFELRYSKTTGRAQQMWQRGCATADVCLRKYMPPSDFVSDSELEQRHSHD